MRTRVFYLLIAVICALVGDVAYGQLPPSASAADARRGAEHVDRLLEQHWQARNVTAAKPATPAEFARRLSLDLNGRVPTSDEWAEMSKAISDGRTAELVDRLIDGPEFSLHFARVIDGWIQHRQAGDDTYVEWLRRSLDERRSWDALFRSMLVGPWESEADKPAGRFLLKRIKNLDALTADTTRAFFGVDITCARCHDHPLVSDWTQDHYYGMAAFLNRAVEGKKGSGAIDEKSDGEVTFEARGKGQRTASMMFLAGQKFDSTPKQNRREQLVSAALTERNWLSRAVTNRMWEWFWGRGLVHPVDQMHSSNPPSVPGVLEFLSDDFVAHGFDLRHLARTIVSTRAYAMSSRVDGPAPPDDLFAAARLKPLTPRQFALSVSITVGEAALRGDDQAAARAERYRALEKQSAELLTGLDSTLDGYHASTSEALFLANHAHLRKRLTPSGENLAARLLRETESARRVDGAFQAVLGRAPSDRERAAVAPLRLDDPAQADSALVDLLWALLTSAEYRFCP